MHDIDQEAMDNIHAKFGNRSSQMIFFSKKKNYRGGLAKNFSMGQIQNLISSEDPLGPYLYQIAKQMEQGFCSYRSTTKN